jgi:hypothetical protein
MTAAFSSPQISLPSGRQAQDDNGYVILSRCLTKNPALYLFFAPDGIIGVTKVFIVYQPRQIVPKPSGGALWPLILGSFFPTLQMPIEFYSRSQEEHPQEEFPIDHFRTKLIRIAFSILSGQLPL